MASAGPSKRGVSAKFISLPPLAAGKIVDQLQQDGSIVTARRVCKAMRAFVDSHIKALKLRFDAVLGKETPKLPLTSWPQLTHLELYPTVNQDLRQLGRLAACTHLRRLDIGWGARDWREIRSCPLTIPDLHGISQLTRLTELRLSNTVTTLSDPNPDFTHHASLQQLLDRLPAGVRDAHVYVDSDYLYMERPYQVHVTRHGPGQWAAVRVLTEGLSLHAGLKLLASQLLACRAMLGSPALNRLGLLHIQRIEVLGNSLQRFNLQPLHELLARCNSVEVGRLKVNRTCDVLPVIKLLGTPHELEVGAIKLRLRIGRQQVPMLGAGSGASAGTVLTSRGAASRDDGQHAASSMSPGSMPYVPSSTVLWRRVLRRLVREGDDLEDDGEDEYSDGDLESDARNDSDTCKGCESPVGVLQKPEQLQKQHLLLHGSYIAELAAKPGALSSWLQAVRSKTLRVHSDNTCPPGGSGQPLASYQILPAATSAVVLQCGTEPGDVEAVVKALYNALPQEEPPEALQIEWLAGSCHPRQLYMDALQEEVQRIWDGRPGGCHGGPVGLGGGNSSTLREGDQKLLGQLLAVVSELGKW